MAGIERGLTQNLRYEPFRWELKGDFDPFIPVEKEADYLRKHNIEFEFLPNGSLLIIGLINSDEQPHANIQFTFPTGSYRDPQDKKGVAHLVEHMFASDSVIASKKFRAKYGAETNEETININLSGPASRKAINYGVWPIIPQIFGKIADPTAISDVRFENEKLIMQHEETVKRTDWHKLANKFRSICLFHPNNPIVKSWADENAPNISKADVDEMVDKQLVPKDFLVQSLIWAKREDKNELKARITEQMRSMPRAGLSSQREDLLHLWQTNSEFKMGEVYASHLDTASGNQRVDYLWVGNREYYTLPIIAQQILAKLLDRKLFEFARNNGISYVTESEYSHFGTSLGILGLQIYLPKVSNYEAFAKELYRAIKKEVVVKARDELDYEIATTRAEAKMRSYKQEEFNSIVGNYTMYGRVVNLEKARELPAKIDKHDLDRELEQLLSTEPAIFITGDLE